MPPKTKATTTRTSMPRSSLLRRTLPSAWMPYAELTRADQPHGLLVASSTHMLGLLYAMTVERGPDKDSTIIYTAGRLLLWIILCRSGACAWNDVVDQDFDRQTTRCRNRPIARGALTTKDGCLTAAVFMALAILSLRGLPLGCIRLAFLAIALSTIYPFAKRFTNFPQVLLGVIAGVTVPISAYAANVNALSGALLGPTVCLMSTIMLHLIFYDVAYARQDAADDMKSGVKSMAVLCYSYIPFLLGVLACGAAGLVFWLGRMTDLHLGYFVLGVGGNLLGLGSMVVLVQLGLEMHMKKLGGWCFVVAFGSVIGAFVTQM